MSRRKITPTSHERAFGIDELFFSATNRKAIISSGNDVFLRVSGLPRDELIGHPHNVVRHPDMPRSVFRVFWEYLGAGRPIAAYVKNLAADGSYYWVMASAVPVGDGFVSIRLKPTSPVFDRVRAIYDDVRKVERAIEGDDPAKRKPAIEAGVARLAELLAEAGYADYDAFQYDALAAEVRARDEILGTPAHVRLAHPPAGSAPELVRILEATVSGHERLDALVRNLASYADLSAQLAGKSEFIGSLADDMRLFSLNAMLGAARLGAEGAPLGAVAEIMRSSSDQAGAVIGDLNTDIQTAVRGLGDLSLRVAASKLQAEMMMVFVHELLGTRADGEDRQADGDVNRDLAMLSAALHEGVTGMLGALDRLGADLVSVMNHVGVMERQLNVMRALEVNGRIEAVRVARGDSVESLFRTIAEQVAMARREMAEFAGVGRFTEQRDTAAERALAEDVGAVGRHVAALAAAA